MACPPQWSPFLVIENLMFRAIIFWFWYLSSYLFSCLTFSTFVCGNQTLQTPNSLQNTWWDCCVVVKNYQHLKAVHVPYFKVFDTAL